jgi:superfamily II DNA or RNA helicase
MTTAALELPLTPSVPTLDEIQAFAVDRLFAEMDAGATGRFLNMATGIGKTRCATMFARRMIDRTAGRVLFLNHEEELVNQSADAFADRGFHVVVEMAAQHAVEKVRWGSMLGRPYDVVVGSKDSMQGDRLARWKPDDFAAIVFDEADLATSPTWRNVLNYFTGSRFALFLTATLYPIAGRPVVGVPGALVPDPGDRPAFPLEGLPPGSRVPTAVAFKYPIAAGIRNGHLADVVAKSIAVNVDLRGIRTSGRGRAADFNRGDLEDRISAKMEPILRGFKGKMRELGVTRAIAFWPDVASCRAAADGFVQLGLRARAIHGNAKRFPMPRPLRRSVVRQYKRGDLDILCCARLGGVGFDDPGTQAVLMAEATKSLRKFIQRVGRVTRRHESKELGLIATRTTGYVGYVIGVEWEGAEGVVSTLDMFLEDEPDPRVREIARKLSRVAKGDVKPAELLEQARLIKERDDDEERRRAERSTDGPANFKCRTWSPYSDGVRDVLGVAPLPREPRPADARPILPGQADLLLSYGFPRKDVHSLTAEQADRLIGPIQSATLRGLATPRQVRRLIDEHGLTPERARATKQHDAARLLGGECSPGLRFVLQKAGYSDADIGRMTPAERGRIYGSIRARRA